MLPVILAVVGAGVGLAIQKNQKPTSPKNREEPKDLDDQINEFFTNFDLEKDPKEKINLLSRMIEAQSKTAIDTKLKLRPGNKTARNYFEMKYQSEVDFFEWLNDELDKLLENSPLSQLNLISWKDLKKK